jgi:hypothetical protein
MADHPSEQRRGRLKHGNPPGDLSTVFRCGARTRRATACRAPAMRNGRCRLHWGREYRPEDRRGARAKPTGAVDPRLLLKRRQSATRLGAAEVSDGGGAVVSGFGDGRRGEV